jgi:hypothetical protein
MQWRERQEFSRARAKNPHTFTGIQPLLREFSK